MKLRGAAETKEAIARDYFIPLECFACQETIFCIRDADYVICPACRTVSPLMEEEVSVLEGEVREGGVGLGFTFDGLAKFQEEIQRRRWQEQQNSQGRQSLSSFLQR